MSTGMRARMATMRMRMRIRRKNHRKSMMDQCRMWKTVLGSGDIDRHEGEDSDDVDVDEEEAASQAYDGSRQNMEH